MAAAEAEAPLLLAIINGFGLRLMTLTDGDFSIPFLPDTVMTGRVGDEDTLHRHGNSQPMFKKGYTRNIYIN